MGMRCVIVLCLLMAVVWSNETCEVVESHGYACESHTATTEDGYVLVLNRIPPKVTNQNNGKVVYLQHGLSSAATTWVLNPPSESLPFLLSQLGYNVWLGNSRGNGISMKNIHYGVNTTEFWDFSWDDMAEYDLPASVDYILAHTKQDTLSYIGVSQGSAIAFSGFLNETLAKKVNIFIALAPVAFVHHQKSIVFSLLAQMELGQVLKLLGRREWAMSEAIHKLLPNACEMFPKMCEFIISFVVGPSVSLNHSRMSYYAEYQPYPTSVKNMIHWAQSVRQDVFRRYDYGEKGNIAHYGSKTPPIYDLTKFPTSLPIALFTGGEDYLADPIDVAHLVSLLPNPPVLTKHVDNYSHIDPMLAMNAHTVEYPDVFRLLEQYSK